MEGIRKCGASRMRSILVIKRIGHRMVLTRVIIAGVWHCVVGLGWRELMMMRGNILDAGRCSRKSWRLEMMVI